MATFNSIRLAQRLIAIALAVSMAISGTAGAYAASTFGPHLRPAVGRFDIVPVRFISPDTLDPTMPGVGTNRYSYAGNDPVNKSDPNGHWLGAVGALLGAIAGAFFGGTKEANTPTKDNDISHTSDGESLANMAAGAVGVGVAGKFAKELLSSRKEKEKKQSVETTDELGQDVNVQPNFSRELTAEDLGLQGDIHDLKGTVKLKDGVMTVRVDYVQGRLANSPKDILSNIKSFAKSQGASSLNLEASIANPAIDRIMSRFEVQTITDTVPGRVGTIQSYTIPLN